MTQVFLGLGGHTVQVMHYKFKKAQLIYFENTTCEYDCKNYYLDSLLSLSRVLISILTCKFVSIFELVVADQTDMSRVGVIISLTVT